VVLSVGRIDRLKGFDLFREAIPAILDRRDDLQFIFVGPQQESFEVPHRHEDRVTLIGAVPPAEIPKYFSAADLYLHPSRTEGLPRVLLEALFAGTPGLATSVGEIPSVTDNTFETTEELVEAVVTFESLRVDDSSVYSRERRQEDFIQFFSSI
jgi:glycosyltransferase involved in cell wall biosynthesis